MFNETFNTKGRKFDFDGKDNPFMKIADYVSTYGADDILVVKGMYTHNKSRFGETAVIMLDAVNLDCPSHLIEMVKTVLASDAMVAAVNEGKCGLKLHSYTDNHGTERWSATFVDI